MLPYDFSFSPYYDEWKDYTLPKLCKERLAEVCKDIMSKGENSRFEYIYAAIYELVEADLETEKMEDYYDGAL
jgi:hypothetical protein